MALGMQSVSCGGAGHVAVSAGRRGAVRAPVRAAVKAPSVKNTEVLGTPPSYGKQSGPMVIVEGDEERKLYRMKQEQFEVIESMNDFVVEDVMPLLLKTTDAWQAQDYLPDPQSDTFMEEVAELRKRAVDVDDELLVVLVGDMITEEALPTYMNMLNTLDATQDQTGRDMSPWARWTRAWTAEENRHGDLMNKYMWLTGKVDMKSIEYTIQNLISDGMDPSTDKNPYLGYIYTSFQERATRISHGNTARLAGKAGDVEMARMCRMIAGDEARHEKAYKKITEELFRRDPDGTMLAFDYMMARQIVMPAHLMDDTQYGPQLFEDYALVAQKIGVYTAQDYADITKHLLQHWGIENIKCSSPEAQEAQERVMGLGKRYDRLASVAAKRLAKPQGRELKFNWINQRPISV